MQPPGVVPFLQETGDHDLCFCRGSEGATVKQFAFERSEEALRHGVIIAVSHGAGRLSHACFPAALTKDERRVLGAVVRVVDHVIRPPQLHCHLKRIEHDLHMQACGHRVADDAAAEDVHDDCEVKKPRPCGNMGDISHPESIWGLRGEVAADKVLRRALTGPTDRHTASSTSAHAHQAGNPHQSSDAMTADVPAFRFQLGMNARRAISAGGEAVNCRDALCEPGIEPRSRGGDTSAPVVEAAGRDAQDSAHHPHVMLSSMCLDKLEDLRRPFLASRPHQSAAFFKISHSCLSRWLSRRKRYICCRVDWSRSLPLGVVAILSDGFFQDIVITSY